MAKQNKPVMQSLALGAESHEDGPSEFIKNMEARSILDKRDFLAFVEAKGYRNWDPLSKEGMELQAMYIQECSVHPLDVLARISTNVYCTPTERISATKTLLEYSMRKVPSTVDVNQTTSALKIDASALSALSLEELETLQALLAKAQAPGT
jgi:hypothetical protein